MLIDCQGSFNDMQAEDPMSYPVGFMDLVRPDNPSGKQGGLRILEFLNTFDECH